MWQESVAWLGGGFRWRRRLRVDLFEGEASKNPLLKRLVGIVKVGLQVDPMAPLQHVTRLGGIGRSAAHDLVDNHEVLLVRKDGEAGGDDVVRQAEGIVVDDQVVDVSVHDDLEHFVARVEHRVDADAVLHDHGEEPHDAEHQRGEVGPADVVPRGRGRRRVLAEVGRGRDRVVRRGVVDGDSLLDPSGGASDGHVALAVRPSGRAVRAGGRERVDVDRERAITVVDHGGGSHTGVAFGAVALARELRKHDHRLAERASAVAHRVEQLRAEVVDDARMGVARALLGRGQLGEPSGAEHVRPAPGETLVGTIALVDLLQHAWPHAVVVREPVRLAVVVGTVDAQLLEPAVDRATHLVRVAVGWERGVTVDTDVEEHVADARGDAGLDERVHVLACASRGLDRLEAKTEGARERLDRELLRAHVGLVERDVRARPLGLRRVHLEGLVAPEVQEAGGLRDGLEADEARPAGLLADLREETELGLGIQGRTGLLVLDAEVARSLRGRDHASIGTATPHGDADRRVGVRDLRGDSDTTGGGTERLEGGVKDGVRHGHGGGLRSKDLAEVVKRFASSSR